MLTILRSWTPTAASVAVAIVMCGTQHGRGLIDAHPLRYVLGLAAWAVITHLLPSPVPKFKALGD